MEENIFEVFVLICFRSPDGTELLASMESGKILVMTKNQKTCDYLNKIKGNLSGFNDFDWYPWMSSSLEGSDILVTSSKDLPLQLWSSGEGKVVCSWTAKDHLDQVANCLSVAFSPDGQKVVSGGKGKLWMFDTNRPGDNSIAVFQTTPNKRSKSGQNGIISCLNFRYDNTGLFSAGSFNGTIGIYDSRRIFGNDGGSVLCLFDAHNHGITQVKFLNDGWSILSSGRRDNCLKKWDLRMLQHNTRCNDPVMEYNLEEYSKTNQRIYFDTSMDGKLYTGSLCNLLEFQIATGEILTKASFIDIVSSVTLNNDGILAVSSGSRNFDSDFNNTSESDAENECEENRFGGYISLLKR